MSTTLNKIGIGNNFQSKEMELINEKNKFLENIYEKLIEKNTNDIHLNSNSNAFEYFNKFSTYKKNEYENFNLTKK